MSPGCSKPPREDDERTFSVVRQQIQTSGRDLMTFPGARTRGVPGSGDPLGGHREGAQRERSRGHPGLISTWTDHAAPTLHQYGHQCSQSELAGVRHTLGSRRTGNGPVTTHSESRGN